MEQPQDQPQLHGQSRDAPGAPPGVPDVIEQAEDLMAQVRQNLAVNDFASALTHFMDLRPADQAELVRELRSGQQEEMLRSMTPEVAAGLLEHMEPEEAVEVFGAMETSALSAALDQTAPDVAVDFLRQLPQEQSLETLEAMEDRDEVALLLGYSDETAGGLMTPEFVSIRAGATADNALDSVRIFGPRVEDVGSILVVDEDRRLVGSLGLVNLALARPGSLVSELMDPEVVSVQAETDQEECARLMERYDLSCLPVIDAESRLLGVILTEDLVDVLQEEATEDMFSMTGIAGERLFNPFFSSMRRRLPWLYLNLGTAVLAAAVVSLFESTIEKLVVLAVFLPVIAGQGGIGGAQTLTLVIRSMALGELPARRAFRLLVREAGLGILHGALLGVAVGLVAWAWKGNFMLGVVLCLAMVGNMIVAGLAGAATPIALRALRLDPALGAAVIVTTITDIVGFVLFLGIAAALLSLLI